MENVQLTKHFSFFELTNTGKSDLLLANRIDAQKYMKQLKYTAGALEEIRALLGVPLTVSSGYRNNALNARVGGSKTSKHKDGLCADVVPIGMDVKKAFSIIDNSRDKLHSVRKVIIECVGDKKWLHVQAKVDASEELELFTTSNGKSYTEVV